MSQKLLFSEILKYIKTTKDAEQLVSQVDQLLARIYSINKQSFEQELEAHLNLNLAAAVRMIFKQQQLSWTNEEQMKLFLEELINEITSAKIVGLTLAIEPTHNLIEILSEWVRNNINPTAILEITTDPSIIGGAIIIYEGKYIDVSLRKKLDDLFINNQKEIINLLNS